MHNNSGITRQTREEGFQFALPLIATIQAAVIDALQQHSSGLTAEEVQAITGYSLNSCRSRLTELKARGRVVTTGKRRSPKSGVAVAIWSVA